MRKDEPAVEPDDHHRRAAARERAAIQERAKKRYTEKSRLQQLGLPTETSTQKLADMDDRHVERPQREQRISGVCVAGRGRRGTETGPRHETSSKPSSETPNQKTLGKFDEAFRRSNRNELVSRCRYTSAKSGNPVVPDQRPSDLPHRAEKGDEVNETQQSQQNEAREPVFGLRLGSRGRLLRKRFFGG